MDLVPLIRGALRKSGVAMKIPRVFRGIGVLSEHVYATAGADSLCACLLDICEVLMHDEFRLVYHPMAPDGRQVADRYPEAHQGTLGLFLELVLLCVTTVCSLIFLGEYDASLLLIAPYNRARYRVFAEGEYPQVAMSDGELRALPTALRAQDHHVVVVRVHGKVAYIGKNIPYDGKRMGNETFNAISHVSASL